MQETFELKKQLHETRTELAAALYKQDAAERTVALAPSSWMPMSHVMFVRGRPSTVSGHMSVGGVGYSFAMSDKYDSRVNGTRTLLRIHPDGGSAGTEGCLGIVGNADVQRRFREDMLAEIRRNGGSYTLTVR